ncbi:hypothetical protein F4009_20945 [Candidatus Poribacteria bacterium]|nr:hypothetical protein [Candidatus Poribacteria bacterium]MYH80684.1 hypothetical protein [Candidatus Poribacteria bacterium]MYK96429.1 hypothetical protein [Candidatus Poribacteria bacterium]
MPFLFQRKKSTAIPLIWLLIYLIIIPMQLSNYVLCIGTDGHVALEVSVNGHCRDIHAFDSEHAEVTVAGTTTEEDHCGPCIDLAIFVPLNTQLYLVPANDGSIQPTVSAFALVPHEKSTAVILRLTHPEALSSFINPTLISLRTTTLLI